MKTTALFILFFFTVTGTMQAQRRLPGQQSLQVTVGAVDGFGKKSVHAGVAFSRFTKNGNRWEYGAEYLRKKLAYNDKQLIPIEQFTGEGGFHLTLLSDGSKTLFCSAGISAMAGYELINRNQNLLYDGATILSESRFIFGGALSFDVEIYLVDRLILLTGIKERILPASTVNKAHFQINFGVKFILN